MEHFAGARDLRDLLSVAAKLRHLANDTLCQGDRGLYLLAAEALETRAEWLAAALPEQIQQDIEVIPNPALHKPVNVIV